MQNVKLYLENTYKTTYNTSNLFHLYCHFHFNEAVCTENCCFKCNSAVKMVEQNLYCYICFIFLCCCTPQTSTTFFSFLAHRLRMLITLKIAIKSENDNTSEIGVKYCKSCKCFLGTILHSVMVFG